MPTLEIPREQWREHFDRLSRNKIGSLVSIEVVDADAGVGMEARNVALEGVVADVRHGKGSLEIGITTASGQHLAHLVEAPTRIHLKESDGGRLETLEVETESGTLTMLHFRPAVLPAEA